MKQELIAVNRRNIVQQIFQRYSISNCWYGCQRVPILIMIQASLPHVSILRFLLQAFSRKIVATYLVAKEKHK